jgi:hypothetical protein
MPTSPRRYSFMAVLGVVADEDDDGNKASTPRRQAPAPTRNEQAEVASKVMEVMTEDEPPTESQLKQIRELRKELGYSETTTEAKIKLIRTKAIAGASIEKLTKERDERDSDEQV